MTEVFETLSKNLPLPHYIINMLCSGLDFPWTSKNLWFKTNLEWKIENFSSCFLMFSFLLFPCTRAALTLPAPGVLQEPYIHERPDKPTPFASFCLHKEIQIQKNTKTNTNTMTKKKKNTKTNTNININTNCNAWSVSLHFIQSVLYQVLTF